MAIKFTDARWAFCLVFAIMPRLAQAQGLDTLGNRASALGAFVAVADDAAAVVWNPSGLVHGPIFNGLLDLGQKTVEPSATVLSAPTGAGRLSTSLIALAVWPVGLSYYRLRLTEVDPSGSPAAGGSPGRQDRQVVVRTLVTTHLGVTVLQSVGERLTVGATVKLVRGSLAVDAGQTAEWGGGFAIADGVEGRATTTADVDLGAMYAAGRVRAGVVVRNLTTPAFEDGQRPGVAMSLDRHVRAGVAWGNRWPGNSTLIAALDADVTRVASPAGERRDVAGGVERWFRAQRFALRGGVRASTIGDLRPMASGGGSIAVRNGFFVDLYAARGRAADRGWGVAARLNY